MKWKEISVIAEQSCSEAIAGLFHQLGCGGVVIEDPHLARQHIENQDWDAHEFSPDFIDREFIVVKAYFPEDRDVSSQIATGLREVEGTFGVDCHCLVEDVNDEDWANSWKDYYHVERVGARLVIKPSWEEYQPQSGDIVVEMDPGMAFGTGTHTTTRFCLQLLEKYLQKGKSLADVGTGSGILAIAGAKLGAGRVTAIEIDETAARIARENVARNGLRDRVEVLNLDFTQKYEEEVDMLVSNLTAELVRDIMPKVSRIVRGGGYLLASGIINSKWPMVQKALESNGLVLEEMLQGKEWIAIAARKGW